MRLNVPLLRLPIRFDANALAAEIDALPAKAWIPHPNLIPGNEAVLLVTAGGTLNPQHSGAMAATDYLKACPGLMGVMETLGAVWGHSRLMRIAPGATVPPHVDIHYYWRTHVRLHVPIVTTPKVRFTCADETVHMAAGESWVFDTFSLHHVQNGGADARIHLVLDTVGGEGLWDLIDEARRSQAAPRLMPFGGHGKGLVFETVNAPTVMTPWELRYHLEFLVDQAAVDPALDRIRARVDRLVTGWSGLWAQYGTAAAGASAYLALAETFQAWMRAEPFEHLRLRNGLPLVRQFGETIHAVKTGISEMAAVTQSDPLPHPVFIVSPPRSGSTLLFETMAQAPELFTIGTESHNLIEGIAGLHPHQREWDSNRLTAADATPEIAAALRSGFRANLRDRDGALPNGPSTMLEKTPKNSLRVPFFDAIFPDARFVYLYRDPKETLASMIEAWKSGRFVTYPRLPGWPGLPWSLLLVPNWRALRGRPLEEIVAHQWAETTNQLLDDLDRLPRERVRVVRFADFLASPQETMKELSASLGLDWDRPLGQQLPASATTVTRPETAKWERYATEIDRVWPIIKGAATRASAWVSH